MGGDFGSDSATWPSVDDGGGVTRREVLAFAAAAPLVGLGTPARAAVAVRAERIRAVVDTQIVQGAGFAGCLRRRGGQVFGYAGDMAKLWFDTLLPALRAERGPLLGLTDSRALFCFERLAWDAGMRVRLHIGHSPTANGFDHAVAGCPKAKLALQDSRHADFGAAAADFALDSRPLWGDRTHASSIAAGTIATWVVAPVEVA